MANKIIDFANDSNSTELSSSYRYADVSMIAQPYAAAKPQQRANVIKLLKQNELLNDLILNENDIDAICIYFDKTNDITDAYNLWLQKAKYKVGKNIDIVAVQNAIHNIFTWLPGERILNPEFGADLRKLLYEGITDSNVEKITAEINHAISTWEPRVSVEKISDITTIDDKENNTVALRIVYKILGLDDQTFTYDYVTTAAEAY